MIKTIIFDFDGTIGDSLSLSIDCVNKLSDEYGYKKIDNLTTIRHKGARRIIKDDLKLSFYQLPKYILKLKKLTREKRGEVFIFNNNIKEVIKNISKSYSLGMITSNSPKMIHHILEKEHLSPDIFDFIFSDASIFGKHKSIKKVMSKYSINNNEVIYIGDEVRDIEACKKAGIKIISVSWGYNSKEILSANFPDYLIDKPEDILDILSRSRSAA